MKKNAILTNCRRLLQDKWYLRFSGGMCLFTSYRLHRMPKPSTAYKWQDFMQKTFREGALHYNMQRRVLIQIWGNNNIRLWSWHWLEMEWEGGHWRSSLHKYVYLCHLILPFYVDVTCFGTENPSRGNLRVVNHAQTEQTRFFSGVKES